MTPLGIQLEVGQEWKENDKRVNTTFKIAGWNTKTERVQLDRGPMFKTWAALRRFNGKSGGYSPVVRRG